MTRPARRSSLSKAHSKISTLSPRPKAVKLMAHIMIKTEYPGYNMALLNGRNNRSKLVSRLSITLLTLFAISACSTAPKEAPTPPDMQGGFTQCESPRPQMCTREYRPVCGHVDTGIRCVTVPCPSERHKTYGNACGACADEKVIGYEVGDCASYGK